MDASSNRRKVMCPPADSPFNGGDAGLHAGKTHYQPLADAIDLFLMSIPAVPKKNLMIALWMNALGVLTIWIGASDMQRQCAYWTF